MIDRKRFWPGAVKMVLAALLAAAVPVASAAPSYAAVDVPDTIRVALFIDTGTYQDVTPVATLLSDGGLKLSWRGAGQPAPIGEAAPSSPVRFQADGYRAKLLETADLNAAVAVLEKVQAGSKAGFITALYKSRKTVYQVTEGVYPTAAAARTALGKWKSAAAGFESLTPASVLGPYALEAGPYASEKEAESAAAAFGGAGLDAFVAVKPADGASAFYVRIGQAASPEELAALKTAAASVGRGAGDAQAGPYAVIRNDMTYAGGRGAAVPLYAVSADGGAAIRAESPDGEPIQVVERYKRSYRGSMEMSVLNGDLAVVNEVGLEQYLYSVIGSEMPPSWNAEALKAQAVAARSYALASGVGYKIANVVDTTSSQSYTGVQQETKSTIAAVDATRGEVLVSDGHIVQAVFSSNAGGVTADPAEVWRNPVGYLAGGIESPDDGPEKGLHQWFKVVTPAGEVGYIRDDLAADSGRTNAAGAKLLQVTGDGVAVRPGPQIDSGADPLDRLNKGTLVVLLDEVPESNNYRWIEGPLSPDRLLVSLNKRAKTPIAGPLQTLEVSKRGPSGRVVEVKANGAAVDVGVPDNLRSAMGGIRSTLFDIEETGRFTILDGKGNRRELPNQPGTLKAEGAGGNARVLGDENVLFLDGSGRLRAATTKPAFVITGRGYGHGLGLSQWGAKAMADEGYDYQSILKHYYPNTTIGKGAGS